MLALGIYLNPGNIGFERILNGSYVDKTGMIRIINRSIGTTDNLICISRPRRFGKSYAAQMLCAYYDKTCDSSALFEKCLVSQDETYRTYLNRYDVIYLDMTNIMGEGGKTEIVPFLRRKITEELKQAYPDLTEDESFSTTLVRAIELAGNQIIMIIDEWDAPIREVPEIQHEYLEFLRTLFKGSGTTSKIFAAVYMTGILPIKKDGSQSAISDFTEYPILDPGEFAEYTGFTEQEVQMLCKEYGMSFADAKAWYDGYDFPEAGAVYNPYSVMSAMKKGKYRSYWQKTSAAESLMTYINMDFEGLQEIIARLISGEEIAVKTDRFENDLKTFRSKDDVLTLLIHLGYLTYHEEDSTARIPNEEVRIEFEKILDGTGVSAKWVELIHRSQKLLEDTIAGDSEEVVKAIEAIRDTQYAPTFYNDEQALRYVIKFAYLAAIEHYLKIEELPSGHGIADVAYLPKRMSRYPAMVVELKWNKPSKGAIDQIRQNNYPAVLKEYDGEVLLVGISYDARSKKHSCRIEYLQER